MELNLNKRNALVCGSSQGIGRAVAIELANNGANVVLFARNEESLEKVLAELSVADGQTHHYLCADFSDRDQVQETIDKYLSQGNQINILVNNTGGPSPGPASQANLKEFQDAFSQHLLCNQILAQSVIEGMKADGYGRIINIISTSVKEPITNLGVSNTIRGAVASWSKTLAGELGPYGITVNNVLPGATNTVRLENIIKNKTEQTGKTIDEVSEALCSVIPLRRFAEASEIANAVAFLASPAASYINGINLPVDGGRTSSL